MKFMDGEPIPGCCTLCRDNRSVGYLDIGRFDALCRDCAVDIYKAMEKYINAPPDEHGFECANCGQIWASLAALRAHERHCKGGKVK